MVEKRNKSQIIRDLGDWAHATDNEILMVIPHEARIGFKDTATVVRRVSYGVHPLVVHTAILTPKDEPLNVSFENGDYFESSDQRYAMSRAVERSRGFESMSHYKASAGISE
jgi:hypothetical protein